MDCNRLVEASSGSRLCYVKVCKVFHKFTFSMKKCILHLIFIGETVLSDKDLRIYKIGSVGIGMFSHDFSDLGEIYRANITRSGFETALDYKPRIFLKNFLNY